MIIAAGIHVFEFVGLVVAPLGVSTLKEKAFNFIGSVERVALFLVHLCGKDFQIAADVRAVGRTAFVDHIAKHQYFAGTKDIRWCPVKRTPVQAKAKIALTLRRKTAN